jgi:SAM-dependent methyltransferase
MRRVLQEVATQYVTIDLVGKVGVRGDATRLPFRDASFDLIICSHVLEHVQEDGMAMTELRRVLAPNGVAVVVTPQNPGGPTDEDPSVRDPRERKARFGQSDHVRVYGDDLEVRLRSAGFDAIELMRPAAFSPEEIERYGLGLVGGGFGEVGMFCRSTDVSHSGDENRPTWVGGPTDPRPH